MRRPSKLILPGDPGWDETLSNSYHWNRLRRAAKLPVKRGANIQISGFFIRDTRKNPPMAIFKNCAFEWKEGPLPENVIRAEDLVPFISAQEAYLTIKAKNLPEDEERKLRITALVPDPGLGEPMPTHLFLDKKTMKEM